MKKTLAVLATVAAVGTSAVIAPAPAEARGIGPGLAFGLAAGRACGGCCGERLWAVLLWTGLRLLRSPLLRAGLLRTLRLLWPAVLSAPLLSPLLVTRKARSTPPGFFVEMNAQRRFEVRAVRT